MKNISFVLRAALPVIMVVASVFGARALIHSRPTPPRKPPPEQGALVETVVAHRRAHRVTVRAKGSAIPAREVTLQPEVSGRVVWQHPELVPGGRVRKGEVLLRIDRRDYALAVKEQGAEVNRAQLELDLERGRRKVAEREWKLFGDSPVEPQARALALRLPQLRAATASLRAAQSSLDQAKLQLERTIVSAPFNGLVRSESVEVGQLATPQTPLVILAGTDTYWVQVALPVDELAWLGIPGFNAERGSRVRVRQEVAGQLVVRQGSIVRLLGELDPVGRMARVLVAIKDPLGMRPTANEARAAVLPLLLGAYLNVELEGSQLADVIELPRAALRGGDTVYVMSSENTLESRSVQVLHGRPLAVLVRGQLEDGERVIVTPLGAAVEGMKLRNSSETPAVPRPGTSQGPPKAEAPRGVSHG